MCLASAKYGWPQITRVAITHRVLPVVLRMAAHLPMHLAAYKSR